MHQPMSRKKNLRMSFMSCFALISFCGNIEAQQGSNPTQTNSDLTPKLIQVGSYMGEVGFDSNLISQKACAAGVSEWCVDSAVAELQRQLKAQAKYEAIKKMALKARPNTNTAFLKPETNPPVNLSA